MLKTLVLICATAIDPSSCTPQTAMNVMRLPPSLGDVCGAEAQAAMAEMGIRRDAYPKLVCGR